MKLLGHRYYDKRTGRFISQDPAGDGDNWYWYAGNDPMDETDPTGLFTPPYHNLGMGDVADGTGQMSFGAPSDTWIGEGLELDTVQRTRTGTVTSTVDADGHINHDTIWGPWGDWCVINRTNLGGGMFAQDESYQRRDESDAHYHLRALWWAIKQFATLQLNVDVNRPCGYNGSLPKKKFDM